MDNTFSGQDADDEDEGGDPNFFLDLLTEQIVYLPEHGTIDPFMAPSATGGAAPPADTSFEDFQQMNDTYGFTDAAFLNPPESTENYVDHSSLQRLEPDVFPDGGEDFQEQFERMASTEDSSQGRAPEESVSEPLASAPRNVVKFEEAEMPSLDHMTLFSDGVYRCRYLNCEWKTGEDKKHLLRYVLCL